LYVSETGKEAHRIEGSSADPRSDFSLRFRNGPEGGEKRPNASRKKRILARYGAGLIRSAGSSVTGPERIGSALPHACSWQR